MWQRAMMAGGLVALLLTAGAQAQSPIPSVSLLEQSRDVLIGETFKFCLTFRNTNLKDEAGFGPFVDLVFESQGPQPNPCDGVTFVSARMTGTNPSLPLVPVQTPPSPVAPCGAGSSAHPFGAPAVAPFPAGGEFVTLPLPFGSFEPSQPAVTIEVTAQVDHFANDFSPLRIFARGGFRFGATANGTTAIVNPATVDPSTWPTFTVTPHVLRLTKQFLGVEEVVPGPNFPEHQTIGVEVAPGQTIQNLLLRDCGAVVDAVTVTGPGTATKVSPTCTDIAFPSLTGSTSGPAATVDITFHVLEDMPSITPPDCFALFQDVVSVSDGSWVPLDPRDPPVSSILLQPEILVLTVKSLAVSKKATPAKGGLPGTTIDYVLSFRISDYVTAGNLVIQDTLSDGQSLVPGSVFFRIRDQKGAIGLSAPIPFPPSGLTSTDPETATYVCPGGTGGSSGTGSSDCGSLQQGGTTSTTLAGGTRLTFNVSQVLAQSAAFPQGTLTGGQIAPGGGPAIGQIAFTVKVDDKYKHPKHSPGDDDFVDKDDPLFDQAVITGNVTGSKTAGPCNDTTGSCLTVAGGSAITKEVWARNNVPLVPTPTPGGVPPRFTRLDTITFRIVKTIPTGDAENVTIEDWYPQPVLTVVGFPTTPLPACGSGLPAVGTGCYTASSSIVPAPSVTANTASNSLTFAFPDFNDVTNASATIEIFVTLRISSDPFADGLLLSNVAQECELNSYGQKICQTALALFELSEPKLRIRKGILCATGSCPPPIPSAIVGLPRPFRIPPPAVRCSGPCPRVTGLVSSSNLAGIIAADGSADAGDRVTFVVAVENTGRGEHGAYDVKVADAFTGPGTIDTSSLCVRRGDSAPVTLAPGSALTANGFSLELVDGVDGALADYSPSGGGNILLVTFDVVFNAPAQTPIGSCISNNATLVAYSNIDNGQNFVPAFGGPFQASAAACVRPKDLRKTIVTTSEAHTANGLPWPVAIGEIVRYRLIVQVPEGTASTFAVNDALPSGLTLVGTPTVTTLNVATSLTYSGGPFVFTNLTNNDRDADCEYLLIEFNAIVNNVASNQAGTSLVNRFSVSVNGSTVGTSTPAVVTVVEPQLTVTKDAVVTGSAPFAGQFRVTIRNTSSVTAFDVDIADTRGACEGALQFLGTGSTGGASVITGTAPPWSVAVMPPGSEVTIVYQVPVTCFRCEDLTNTVTVRWSSLPGAGSAPNPTGSVAGSPGTPGGERNGTGGVNDYIATASRSLCGTVCGTKFHDRNANGARDPGEPGLFNWTINATTSAAPIASIALNTAADGTYCFTAFAVPYQVCEQQRPPYWQVTTPAGGCRTVSVPAGQTVSGIDFGNKALCTATVCAQKLVGTTAFGLLPCYPIQATRTDILDAPIVALTGKQGQPACLDLIGPGSYRLSEIPRSDYVPSSGQPAPSYDISVTCTAGTKGFIGTATPAGPFEFHNVACTGCPAGTYCTFTGCKPDPVPNPCTFVRCAFGTCQLISGQAVCVPPLPECEP